MDVLLQGVRNTVGVQWRGRAVQKFVSISKVASVICLANKCSNQDGRHRAFEGVGQQVGP